MDVPKPGFGNSNDGNTARKFFSNPEISGKILGVDPEFIRLIAKALHMISSNETQNIEEFEEVMIRIHTIARNKYNNVNIPPTLHILICHGPFIMRLFDCKLGQYTEESQEKRNKDVRKARLEHARKDTRLHNLEDIAHWLLEESDPVLNKLSSL